MELRPPDQAAMADADIDELGALLELRAVPFKGMSLEMLDGFLSALIVAPEAVSAEEWMPRVWGGRPPRWESRAEEEHVIRLLMALRNDIARRVAIEPERLRDSDTPLIALPESEEAEVDAAIDYGIEWACGFLDGVELRGDAWIAACEAQSWIDESLIGLEAIAEGIWPPAEGEAASEVLTASERLDLIADIPHLLHGFNMHRLEQSTSRVPIRKQAESGRNDPCPCGSGRKFKKCCAVPNQAA